MTERDGELSADDPRLAVMPDVHGHAKGEHKPYLEERPIPYTARMLFLWFFHAARRGAPRFMMVADHVNYLTFEDPAAVNLVRRALKLAEAGDLHGAAETAGVEVGHASVVSEGLRRGMHFVIGAEVDNDPRSRPDAQNIVDAMRPDGLIRSVHFLTIEHPEHGAGWAWAFDNPEFVSLYETLGTERVWELYMHTLLEAIAKLPGHIVGHFYVPAKFGHWPDEASLERYEDQLIAACAERGLAIELNTRFLYRYIEDAAQQERYLKAHRRLLRKAAEHGVGIAVGSDAHSPKDQGVGFEQALELLDEAGINELSFPIGGRLARVALRVVRPPEPPPPEPLPPAETPAAASGPARRARSRGRKVPAAEAAPKIPRERKPARPKPSATPAPVERPAPRKTAARTTPGPNRPAARPAPARKPPAKGAAPPAKPKSKPRPPAPRAKPPAKPAPAKSAAKAAKPATKTRKAAVPARSAKKKAPARTPARAAKPAARSLKRTPPKAKKAAPKRAAPRKASAKKSPAAKKKANKARR